MEILLSVESDGLGFNLSLLDINLVTSEDDGNVLADTDQVTCKKKKIMSVLVHITRLLFAGTYGASWERSCM